MSEKRKFIVVTGGLGFIGNNLVRELNRRGHKDIVVVDHLDKGVKWKNFDGIDFEDYFDRGDFMKLLSEDKLPEISAVFHLGACSSTTETDTAYLMENNYRYTRMLCLWCVTKGARFITASSAASYGDGSRGYCDEDELTPSLSPLNMYGMSKHLFDKWALKNGLYRQIVGLKFFNVYGPHEDHKGDMRSVIWKSFQQIKSQGKVGLFKSYKPEFGDGEQKRDFVFVDDVVKVMLHFAAHREVNGLFNCGTGEARSWNDLAKAVFKALGMEPKIEYVDMPETLQAKYQYFTQADLRKLRASGYNEPFTSLEDGAAAYVKWMQEQAE